MNFSPRRTSATPLFKQCNILKIADNISLQNFLFAHDSLNNNLPSAIRGQLSLVTTGMNTRNEMYQQLDRIRTKTIIYGTNSIKSRSVDVWNFINEIFYLLKLHEKSRSLCKKIVIKFLIDRY